MYKRRNHCGSLIVVLLTTNNFSDLIDPVRVFDMNFTVANSASMKAEYSGRVKFGSVTLETVYFCPTLPLKLISESQMVLKGAEVIKTKLETTILKDNTIVLSGLLDGHLFRLTKCLTAGKLCDVKDWVSVSFPEERRCNAVYTNDDLLLFHQKHGHLNWNDCRTMLGIQADSSVADPVCEACQLAKMRRKRVPKADYVCRLKKSIYGTKQAPRCANKKLRKRLKQCGLDSIKSDDHVYFDKKDAEVLIMCCFVDDLLIGSTSLKRIHQFSGYLKKYFKLTIEEEPTTYLSFELERNREKRYLKMHQNGYLRGMLTDYKLLDCIP